jgi:hypothetical protein
MAPEEAVMRRSPRARSRLLTCVVLVLATVVGAQWAGPAGAGTGGDVAPIDGSRQQAPEVPSGRKATAGPADPGVRAAVRAVRRSRAGALPHLRVRDDRLRVEVLGTGLRAAVREHGGAVVGAVRGLVLADVPAARVRALESTQGVTRVRLPVAVSDAAEQAAGARVGAQGAEPIVKTGASSLHQRGITGSGVRIGIIDTFGVTPWNAAAAAGELPLRPAGEFCLVGGQPCDVWGTGSTHGVAVAETVRDMAPGAELYIASALTATDHKAAIDWFAARGVRVVNQSQVLVYDGPGNGTGPLDQIATYAEGRGITWVKAAGNSGTKVNAVGGYFRGLWSDADGDSYMEFAPGDELLELACGLFMGVRWSDWAAARTDYDIYIWDGDTLVARGEVDQAAGADPIELPVVATDPTRQWSCTPGRTYQLAVYRFAAGGGSAGDVVELMVNRGYVEYASTPFSASSPISDASNRGVVTVGAVDPATGTEIAGYSSQGPTNDGRTKPDVSAPSNFSSHATGFFNGTSAASPVVAGAAALLLQGNPSVGAAGLGDLVRASVVDRGVAGPDNVYGSGELYLVPPPPPPPPPPPAPALTKPSAVTRLTVLGRPSAPRRVVRWRSPRINGGSAVIAYRVKVRHGRKKILGKVVVGSRHRVLLRRSRLPRGKLVVTVRAVNAVGAGPAARRSFVVR